VTVAASGGEIPTPGPRPDPIAGPGQTARSHSWSGLLLVDKPAGVTSHDVVDRVRRRLKARGAGHLGTLDPGASGLLVLALGSATRCAPVWQAGLKTYEGTVRFGVVTSTQDLQGEVLERHEVELDERQVREAALGFVGEIEQVPPMVSALKVDGQRLHRLARKGRVVERRPRRVRIESWEWLGFELPEASFRIVVSGGTYVRTLAHDLGARLGTGGALKRLRRLRSEPFGVEQAVGLRDLDRTAPEEVLARAGVPLAEALRVLPVVVLDRAQAEAVGFGRRPAVEAGEAPLQEGPRSVAFFDSGGEPLALGELEPDRERPAGAIACPHVVFPWAVRQGRA
jgi:tRNA pseudouridine55 synthase